jgi:hypothetical protein
LIPCNYLKIHWQGWFARRILVVFCRLHLGTAALSNPLGYNPIGESAPGLPRHDKPLPGHVPGQYAPIGGDGFGGGGYAPTGGGNSPSSGGFNDAYAGSSWFGTWSARAIMAFITYLTLPVQMALYPLAAMPAFAVGYYVLHASSLAAFGLDASMDNAWTCAWAALLPAIRLETIIEDQIPGYRALRHLFRLAVVAGWFYYTCVHDEGNPPQTGLIIGLIAAVPIHFLLRSRLLKSIWDAFQSMAWLRKR